MKEQKFMENWEKALESYGTPGDFADKSYFINLDGSEFERVSIPLTILVAPGYANRAELMKKQREETDKRKGNPLRWENDMAKCFLCDNIGQAKEIGNNLLLPFDAYTNAVLLPNRYAAMRGHSLVIEKEHQNNGDSLLTLSSNFLANSIELAEKYNISIMRNHPKSGMSIPKHDHFHSYPKIIKIDSGEQPISQIVNCQLRKTDYGEGIFRMDLTRFDTLAFNGKKSLENILKTVRGLERDNIIFTFLYYPKGKENWQGTYFLTPHITPKLDPKGGGAGYGIYFDVSSSKEEKKYEGFIESSKKELYAKGNFKWEEIIK